VGGIIRPPFVLLKGRKKPFQNNDVEGVRKWQITKQFTSKRVQAAGAVHYPMKKVKTVDIHATSPAGPLAMFITEELLVSGVKLDNIKPVD